MWAIWLLLGGVIWVSFLSPFNSPILPSALAEQSRKIDTPAENIAKLQMLKAELEEHEKVLGLDHPDTGLALDALAKTYYALGEYEKSLPMALRALAIFKNTFGVQHRSSAISMANLAHIHGALGQYDKALSFGENALAVLEKVLGEEHSDTAAAKDQLAGTYLALGDYEKALTLQWSAMAVREKVLGPEHFDTAQSLNNVAVSFGHLGQYKKALPLQQRAVTIYEKVLGPEHAYTVKTMGNLASTYEAMAEYEKALSLHQRILTTQEKILGSEHPDTALTLNNIAVIYDDLGQYEKSLPLKERALSIYETALGSGHPNTAVMLNNVATTYRNAGRFEQALPLQLTAVAINEKAFGIDHPKTATGLGNLAYTYSTLGQYEKALLLSQRAVVILEKSLGLNHPHTAVALSILANIYGKFGHYEKALPLKAQALAIDEKTLGPDHPETATSWNNLAVIFSQTNQLDAAIFAGKRAVNITQVARAHVSAIGMTEAASYSEKYRYQYENLSSWLTEAGRISEAQQVLDMLKETEHFDFIRRASDGDPRKTRIGYTRSEQEWLPRYEQISSRLSALGAEQQALEKKTKLGLSDEEKSQQKKLLADLKVAQTAFTAYLNDMRTGFSKKGAARVAEVEESSEQSLKLMQSTLQAMDPGAVLVRYYMTDTQVKIIVTTPGVQLARDAAIAPKELNGKIAAFNAAMRDSKSNPLPLAQELYTALVGPIAQDLQQAGATTVMLYLDGALRYLPFSALHDGQRYLVERWRMPIYTAVAKDKLREAVTSQWTVAGMGVTHPWRDFAALPAVKQELSAIVKTTGFFQWGSGGALPGELFLDGQFTAKSLKDVGQRPFSVVHIASHFRFSPGTEANSALLLGDGQELTLGDIRTQGYSFKNVDLLTLSACETGLGGGRDERGREIEGFGVIAQQQGAKAVLATLWPVADQSTALLMQEMYRQRQEKGLTKAEALRQAQLTVMRQKPYAHPFYWAPFILMGNWL